MIDLEVIVGAPAIAHLAPELDALDARVGAPLSRRRPWLWAWIDVAPDEIHAVTARGRGGDLVGVALLAVRRRGGIVLVRGVGHRLSDHSGFPVVDEGAAEAVARGLTDWFCDVRRPWVLHLDHLDQRDLVVPRLARALPAVRLSPGMPSPWSVLGDDRTLGSNTSSKFRRNRRQALNRAQRDGFDVTVATYRGDQIDEALLETIERIRTRRDTDMGIVSDLDTSVGRSFWRNVMAHFVSSGEALVDVLHLGIDPVAYAISFEDGHTRRMWDGRIDPRFATYSPGHVLSAEILERLLGDRTVREIDWGRGESDYKLRLANRMHHSVDLRAWSSHGVRRVHAGVANGRMRLSEVKNRDERLRRAWTAVRSKTS